MKYYFITVYGFKQGNIAGTFVSQTICGKHPFQHLADIRQFDNDNSMTYHLINFQEITETEYNLYQALKSV